MDITKISPAQLQQYQQQGYVEIKSLVPAHIIEGQFSSFCEALIRIKAEQANLLGKNFSDQMVAEKMEQLSDQQKTDLMTRLNQTVALNTFSSQENFSNLAAQLTDTPRSSLLIKNLQLFVFSLKQPNTSWSQNVTTVDQDKKGENGCHCYYFLSEATQDTHIEILPTSQGIQRSESIEKKETKDIDLVKITPKPGDALYTNLDLLHRFNGTGALFCVKVTYVN